MMSKCWFLSIFFAGALAFEDTNTTMNYFELDESSCEKYGGSGAFDKAQDAFAEMSNCYDKKLKDTDNNMCSNYEATKGCTLALAEKARPCFSKQGVKNIQIWMNVNEFIYKDYCTGKTPLGRSFSVADRSSMSHMTSCIYKNLNITMSDGYYTAWFEGDQSIKICKVFKDAGVMNTCLAAIAKRNKVTPIRLVKVFTPALEIVSKLLGCGKFVIGK